MTVAQLEQLLASPHWRLRVLDLSMNEMDDTVATLLDRCSNLGRLEQLDLSSNPLTASAAELLLRSPRLPRLKWLYFAGTRCQEAGLKRRFGERICFEYQD